MKEKTKREIKSIEEAVSKGYVDIIGWFEQHELITILYVIVLSFAAGVIFVMRFSDPIGNSRIYDATAQRARLAEQGIKTFSQQVIDVTSPVFAALVKDNREEDGFSKKEIAERKEKLKEYLEERNSPFATDDQALQAFAESQNMKLMVAISFVESTFGKNCYYYNCSGIGGAPPNLRRYDSYAEWIYDFDNLLEESYKDLAPEQFIGFYVQPGSPNWLYGVKQVLQELDDQGIAYRGN